MRVHTKISHTYHRGLLLVQLVVSPKLIRVSVDVDSFHSDHLGRPDPTTYYMAGRVLGRSPRRSLFGGLRRFGFAGGLGPSTVLPQLEAMHRDCEASYKDAVVWIDMESRIRSQAREPAKTRTKKTWEMFGG